MSSSSQPAIATPISIKRIERLCLSDSSRMHYYLDNTYHKIFRPKYLSISHRGHKTTKLTLPTDKKAAFSCFISTTCQGDFGSKPINLPKIGHVIFRQFRHALLKEQTAICRRIKYPGQNYTCLFLKGRPGKKSKSIRVALLTFLNGKNV